ncbi:MAG: hypothetical protein HN995_11775 [Candidatus Marinimicrobia bacterium]|nr:hypothetical protein [Candidatus Neomarinimicrobiota bacterium]MBT3575090.1 hypothetical protein [Candidatus Neomarinimicrobiota bacterium]MBT3678862.1 hypothetical protein [Candidatus Neomarinimicrobiota bacterium]MBT3949976.1 hypothetical protein [Candidatus Neomarinimicrobiota bacterium]MBT4252679.1 hypothetical protein [Candidatus Neomarinimicrobiota bacterium]
MNSIISTKIHLKCLTLLLFLMTAGFGQVDSLTVYPEFDSQLLKLKVPDAFQRSSLKLEVFSDSSWQLYRGTEALSFSQSLHLLGQESVLVDYEEHLAREAGFLKDFRSRRVFSMISSIGGVTYLAIIWSKGWVYQIPGYAAIMIGGVRYFESRQYEIQALREQYYLQTLISAARIERLVDDYNFRLYQYLSTAGIQFSDN